MRPTIDLRTILKSREPIAIDWSTYASFAAECDAFRQAIYKWEDGAKTEIQQRFERHATNLKHFQDTKESDEKEIERCKAQEIDLHRSEYNPVTSTVFEAVCDYHSSCHYSSRGRRARL